MITQRDYRNEHVQTTAPDRHSRIRGCLLGGACGDALGAPVEFMEIHEIQENYGIPGIKDFDIYDGRKGAFTDDTQMTLFTLEGILRAQVRGRRGIGYPAMMVHRAYLRWLATQGMASTFECKDTYTGWLVGVKQLHRRRAPGRTCLSALTLPQMGTMEEPLNDGKGCGGVMRVAPAGFVEFADPFRFGCELAAITHGNPTGYLAAGFLAEAIHLLAEGAHLLEAFERSLKRLKEHPDNSECSRAVERALRLYKTGIPPSVHTVECLGGGWVAEEALAIAVYCSLAAGGDFERGIILAVNHSGDSDSTGAITGNILGTLLGAEAIPNRWLNKLELREVIETLAADLARGDDETEVFYRRYPG